VEPRPLGSQSPPRNKVGFVESAHQDHQGHPRTLNGADYEDLDLKPNETVRSCIFPGVEQTLSPTRAQRMLVLAGVSPSRVLPAGSLHFVRMPGAPFSSCSRSRCCPGR
jgi:hypothetical protein